MPGATVGPTFACIIGRQFSNARAGDRFWFERDDPVVGFTPGTYPPLPSNKTRYSGQCWVNVGPASQTVDWH